MKSQDAQRPPWSVVWVLSVTQIISWGSLFYAISVLMAPIERELGWSRDAIVGAFSLSMVCTGLAAFPVGNLIDSLDDEPLEIQGEFGGLGVNLRVGRDGSIELRDPERRPRETPLPPEPRRREREPLRIEDLEQ